MLGVLHRFPLNVHVRNALLGSFIGLIVGITGTLIYEQYMGPGAKLERTQADLDSASAQLAKSEQNSKTEIEGLTSKVNQLTATDGELTDQIEQIKKVSSPPENLPSNAVLQGRIAQEVLRLTSLLHLTPDQAAAAKELMEHEVSAVSSHQKITRSFLQDLQEQVLTPEQKMAYNKMLVDDRTNQADNTSTVETNQLSGLLQLTDAQKDQVYSALYQLQISPSTGPGHSLSDEEAYLDSQAQAKQEALTKILNPNQLSIYTKQVQNQLQLDKAEVEKSFQQSQ